MNSGMQIKLGETYAAHCGLTLLTVSTYAAVDGKVLPKLKGRAGCTLRKAQNVLHWCHENWPEDLAWPADIPRPEVSP